MARWLQTNPCLKVLKGGGFLHLTGFVGKRFKMWFFWFPSFTFKMATIISSASVDNLVTAFDIFFMRRILQKIILNSLSRKDKKYSLYERMYHIF